MKHNLPLPNKGSALVLAMMIVAITAAIAYALIETSTFAVRRTTQLHNTDMCKQAVHAAELYAMELLYQPKDKGPVITDSQERWALPFELNLEKDITVSGEISDLQGQFNLNLLRQSGQEGIYSSDLVFSRLLMLLNIADAQSLQQSLSEWIGDASSEADQVYLERTPAYRPAHSALVSTSELALIQGFTSSKTTVLNPYVSALSEGTNINVNTASSQVLGALLNTSDSAARSLVDERIAYPFNTSDEFIQRAISKGIAIPDQSALSQMINVNSNYFLLKTTASCQKTSLISYSFIERNSEGLAKVYRRTQAL
jgi:general secretion pathway protein K